MRHIAVTVVIIAMVLPGCSSPEAFDRTVVLSGPATPGPDGFAAAAHVDAAVASDGSVTGVVTISGAQLLAFSTGSGPDGTTVTVEIDTSGLAARSSLTRPAAAAAFDRPRPTATTTPDELVATAETHGLGLLGCAVAWATTGDPAVGGCDLVAASDGAWTAWAGPVRLVAEQTVASSDRPAALFTIDDTGAMALDELVGAFTHADVPDVVLLGDPAGIAQAVAGDGADAVPPAGVVVTVLPDGAVQVDAADESACNRDGQVLAGSCP
ncbi:hypothetical protein DVS28_b0456 (plasmid) [Euzebya pacifica]|uniref:Uncharacterized protein n=1 Tax=Euzebya pacifica TaxID=1608957 RepID=A0A346Y6U9_9ACTN|nr:hypothetical protein [Euzebya pacifica]AXV10196.1 hypothetical protein DVS28_b0456 [Euzebya pacifica]